MSVKEELLKKSPKYFTIFCYLEMIAVRGKVKVSISTIAKTLCISQSTVRRAIGYMAEQGIIAVKNKSGSVSEIEIENREHGREQGGRPRRAVVKSGVVGGEFSEVNKVVKNFVNGEQGCDRQENGDQSAAVGDNFVKPDFQLDEKQDICIYDNNNSRDIYKYISLGANFPSNSKKEKEKENKKGASAEMGEVAQKQKGGGSVSINNKEIYRLVASFCEVMGIRQGDASFKRNYKAAKELLQGGYKIEEIIEAVKFGKAKMKKQGKDPKQFITSLVTVQKLIDNWLGEMDENKKEEGSWYIP